MKTDERELRVLIRDRVWCAFQLVKMKATEEEFETATKEIERALELIKELQARK